MQNGHYKVDFVGPYGAGSGVLVIQDGKFFGGDGGIAYAGDIQQSGTSYTVTLRTMAHTPGVQSVLGQANASLTLTGHQTGSGQATLTAPLGNGQNFRADLSQLPNF